MDLNTLKAEHKEIYDQVVNDATKAERERIKAIDDLAMPGFENLVNKAKFETGATAEQLAVEMIKANKNQGNEYFKNSQEDANPLNEVDGQATEEEVKNQEKKEVVNKLTESLNKRRVK